MLIDDSENNFQAVVKKRANMIKQKFGHLWWKIIFNISEDKANQGALKLLYTTSFQVRWKPFQVVCLLLSISLQPSQVINLFLYRLKTSKNLCLYDVFRGYRKMSGMKWVKAWNMFYHWLIYRFSSLFRLIDSFLTLSCNWFLSVPLEGLNLRFKVAKWV